MSSVEDVIPPVFKELVVQKFVKTFQYQKSIYIYKSMTFPCDSITLEPRGRF